MAVVCRTLAEPMLCLVTPQRLPKAAVFIEQVFGTAPERILFFVGPRGTGWDSATFRGIVFHQRDLGRTSEDAFARSFFPAGPLHALDASVGAQDDDVVSFVESELLPALAEVTRGVLTRGRDVVFRGSGASLTSRSFPSFEKLRAAQEALRSAPPDPGEDWSDL